VKTIFRFIVLMLICSICGLIIYYAYNQKCQTPLQSTLVPLYTVLGKPVKSVNASLTKVMPVDEIDEQEYGNAISQRFYSLYKSTTTQAKVDEKYVNDIVSYLNQFARKPFKYRVFIFRYCKSPNAWALPGGVLMVTRGLLDLSESESEIAGILAHEMGHVELSHCLDTVRFQLLTKKIGSECMGRLADFASAVLLRHSFSKTQEEEADEYAYQVLLESKYDPRALGVMFGRMKKYQDKKGRKPTGKHADILRDYFISHPPLELRKERYDIKAQRWWEKNTGSERYVGKKNHTERVHFSIKSFGSDELVTN